MKEESMAYRLSALANRKEDCRKGLSCLSSCPESNAYPFRDSVERKGPLVYISASEMIVEHDKNTHYVPIIKNVITKREILFKDGAGPKSAWEEYIIPACQNVIPENTRARVKTWETVDPEGRYVMYGNGTTIYTIGWGGFYTNYKEVWNMATASCTVFDSGLVMFRSYLGETRLIFRLIDDRIENAAGPDDPYPVAYPSKVSPLISTCNGCWNNWTEQMGVYKQNINDSDVYIMYPWNKVNDYTTPPNIFIPKPDMYSNISFLPN